MLMCLFSGENEKKGLVRDRCKKRVFDKLWSSYSEEFQNWWLNASRDDQTRAVNEGVVRGRGRSLTNEVMARWEMKEDVETKKAKQGAWKSQAVILEVASQIGGEDKLRQAIARGAIIRQVVGGIELFCFPSAASKVMEERKHAVRSNAQTPIIADQHAEFQAWHDHEHLILFWAYP